MEEKIANIELPRDAAGREILLDTMTPYDENGNEYEVNYYTYSVRQTIPQRKWQVVMMDCIVHDVSDLYLTPPDSWEKLLEDLDRAANAKGFGCCAYAGRSEHDCSSCIATDEKACTQPIMRDIAYRIRELRGEDE